MGKLPNSGGWQEFWPIIWQEFNPDFPFCRGFGPFLNHWAQEPKPSRRSVQSWNLRKQTPSIIHQICMYCKIILQKKVMFYKTISLLTLPMIFMVSVDPLLRETDKHMQIRSNKTSSHKQTVSPPPSLTDQNDPNDYLLDWNSGNVSASGLSNGTHSECSDSKPASSIIK